MREDTVYRLETATGVLAIDSAADGLCYMADPDDDPRIAIAGDKGITILTVPQAKALIKELPDILEIFMRRRYYVRRRRRHHGQETNLICI